ncbi:hypothetical protein GCM10025857_34210 [Alicyclobacillus contaminans]|uniref:head-tail connector protein n=1 Tax=Alicyclobacillus contaminans TaxID=392016 RepID=UPI00068486F5|nr:head-tail connector protein [Alicyclobacillus contaminans]GMA52064.1 hypothetical protein GCM10025857_34210 [Alicyclobacillus contaminans]
MILRVFTQPTTEPVTLDEAKLYLRVDGSDEDTLINALIATAREYCESFQNRAYITQTLELTLDQFPGYLTGPHSSWMHEGYRTRHHRRHHAEIRLPRPPIQSVESVTYTDDTGTTTTLDPETYIVDTDSEPGRIVPASGQCWPCVRLQPINGVRIRYVAGYGDTNAVPNRVKQAIQLLVGHWYLNREAVGNVGGEVEFAVKALLSQERVVPT